MTSMEADTLEIGRQFLNSIDKTQIRAAASKLFAASIGELVTVFSRSPAHKHYSLADIEWMVMPSAFAGQFYIVEAVGKEHGYCAPVAAVTWAYVSAEVDKQLTDEVGSLCRLRPDQWKCGTIPWLIDAAGDGEGVRTALKWLCAGAFKDQPLKMIVRGEDGAARVTTLDAFLAQKAEGGNGS
jgi:hemolysin-activating ACP:hemolysin acyltransferase